MCTNRFDQPNRNRARPEPAQRSFLQFQARSIPGTCAQKNLGLTEDLFDVRPCGIASSGHEGRPVPRTFLTTRYTRTDKEKSFLLKLVSPADRIRVVGVTAIDDDVAFLEMRFELTDKVIDGSTGLDEEDDPAGLFEFGAQLLDGMRADNIGSWAVSVTRNMPSDCITLRLVLKKIVDLRGRSATHEQADQGS